MNQNYTYIETNGQMSFAAQTQRNDFCGAVCRGFEGRIRAKKVPEEERCSPSGRRSENSSVQLL